MKAKHSRQEILVEIVQSQRIKSQDELKQILVQQGIDVAQATLSRDLRELGIVKSHDASGYFFNMPGRARKEAMQRPIPAFADGGVIHVACNGTLIVLKVKPGYAGMIASHIDAAHCSGILGTVAGDDTILVVLRHSTGPRAAVALISSMFPHMECKKF